MTTGSILIAEDSAEIREVLTTYVSDKGYKVTEADNGSRAAEILDQQPFDLIISDINMPGLDGMTLLDRVKESYPDTPFVLITGFPSMENAIQAVRRGAADYITKPFKFNQIDLVLKKFVNDRKKERHAKTLAENSQKEVIEKLNEKLNRKIQELSKLYHISESLSHITDEEKLFQQVVEVAAEVTQTERAYLLFRDGDSGEFFIKTAKSPGISTLIPEETHVDGPALRTLVRIQKPITSTGDQVLHIVLGDEVFGLSSFLLAPLTVKRELFGAVIVSSDDHLREFSKDDELILMDLCRKMTLSLENSMLYHTLYMHVINTLQSLVASVEAKDAYTERHSHRVTQMAKKVALYMGCTAGEIDALEFAGLLHDIGKIGVRDMVLQKTTRLTDDEWKEIRRHPEIGESIVRPLKLFPLEASIIRHHHERWDGKGYPDGLQGEECPFLARIIAVADSFDAMVSNRPYRSRKPAQVAIEELKRCRATQFDPQVVDAFVAVFQGQIHSEKWDGMMALDNPLSERSRMNDEKQEKGETAPFFPQNLAHSNA